MRILTAGLLLLFGGCLMGCAAAPKTFTDGLLAIEKAAKLAKDQGVSWHADATWDGSPGLEIGYFGRINSGVAVSIHFQGNAQTAAADKAPIAASDDENPTSGDE